MEPTEAPQKASAASTGLPPANVQRHPHEIPTASATSQRDNVLYV